MGIEPRVCVTSLNPEKRKPCYRIKQGRRSKNSWNCGLKNSVRRRYRTTSIPCHNMAPVLLLSPTPIQLQTRPVVHRCHLSTQYSQCHLLRGSIIITISIIIHPVSLPLPCPSSIIEISSESTIATLPTALSHETMKVSTSF